MTETNKDYSKYFVLIKEDEVRDWRPAPRSFTTRLFEAFVESDDQMVEVKVEKLPEPEHKEGSKVKSDKKDSFASSFYSWKKRKKTQQLLKKLGIDEVLLIRRGERIALKKRMKK